VSIQSKHGEHQYIWFEEAVDISHLESVGVVVEIVLKDRRYGSTSNVKVCISYFCWAFSHDILSCNIAPLSTTKKFVCIELGSLDVDEG